MNNLHTQQQHLKQAVTRALALAAPECEGAEVSITKTTGLSVSTRLGTLENIEFNSDGALGITVYRNQRRGSATTTDLRPAAIAQAVKAALEMVRYTSPDPCTGLADAALMAFNTPTLDLWHPWNITPESATEMAVQAEQKALAVDKRVVNSEGAVVNSHCSLHLYGNSNGMLNSYPSSRHSISCCLIAEQAGCMERDYAYTVARDPTDLQDPDWIGSEAAKRVLARLGARQIPTQQTPVLLSAEVASTLLGHLASAISGGNLYRKSSFLLDHLGQQILPDWLSIIEQPHRCKGLASTPFDAEGVRTREQHIVAHGKLQTYLLNSYQARKLSMQSTGHAGGIHNWQVIADQSENFTTLLHRMQRGLVVTELMGQGVNIVTGDYSRGAAGFWVEEGEIQYPVHEVTIAADLKTMLRNIVAIGNDIETRTTIQTGSLLLESMKIAGA